MQLFCVLTFLVHAWTLSPLTLPISDFSPSWPCYIIIHALFTNCFAHCTHSNKYLILMTWWQFAVVCDLPLLFVFYHTSLYALTTVYYWPWYFGIVCLICGLTVYKSWVSTIFHSNLPCLCVVLWLFTFVLSPTFHLICPVLNLSPHLSMF